MIFEFNLENARISFSGNEKTMAQKFEFQYNFQYHINSCHEIFFVKRGDFKIKIESKDYLLRSNNFIVVPAGASHTAFQKDENAWVACLVIEFYKNNKKKPKIKHDVFGLLNKLISRTGKPYIFRGCSKVINKLELFADAAKDKKSLLYEEYMTHFAAIFIIELICFMDGVKSSAPPPSGINGVLQEKRSYANIIENYINDLSNDKISLAELSGTLHLSKTQTIRLIKQIYNAKFSDIILNNRINTAKNLLRSTDLSIERIADEIKYSYNGFLRVFKKSTGKTPSEYRNNK